MSIENFERNSFLAGGNAAFVEDLYARYVENATSVPAEWQEFFSELREEAPNITKSLEGASWAPRGNRVVGVSDASEKLNSNGHAASVSSEESRQATVDSLHALMLIRSYRVRGHLASNMDPLGLYRHEKNSELDYRSYGFTEADLDKPIFIDNVLGLEYPTLREINDRLQQTYCGTIGVEFMHIQEPDQKQWIQERIEGSHNRTDFTQRGKEAILERLSEAEGFENFLNVKYPGAKRFGLDGGESLIPALEQILKRGSQLGIEEVVIGMPHRGRLSVLANVLKKPYVAILSEFQGQSSNPEEVQGSGDVKYHLGTSADVVFDDKNVHLSLSPNPSHLEAVDPVIVGRVRAKQLQLKDQERRRVMGILMHGDAAFAGQGLVAETFALSAVPGYRAGGTIHFIVNNQIGFTTNPRDSRSSPYPSDVSKTVQSPIFHVNGDDPEAVVHVARIATEFRQEFRKDVVIDMWCYRRFGHNEGDEPAFTQPIMYRKIADQPSTRTIYADKLVQEGSVSEDFTKALTDRIRDELNEDFEAASNFKPNKADWLDGKWSHLEVAPTVEDRRGKTDLPVESLKEIGNALVQIPETFNLHPKLNRFVDARKKMIDTGNGIDWSTAEALAFGTLVKEGHLVRLAGQDVQRGTFSQRHAYLIDQETEEHYVPLQNVAHDQARFVAHNSPLSEAGVLGFEYGISLVAPDALVMWEAQFGDFANGAQVIIDQFIASAESKWLRMSGIVMLLPHGYEGQGPEHSSARLERYLQLCGEDNMQVVMPSTPSNYFHVLRRQIHRSFRKPLIVMTPKSLLRHKLCVSTLDDMGPGSCFHRVLPEADKLVADSKIKRVVLCSGKVYYDLYAERNERGLDDVAIVRIEQLYPFPAMSLTEQLQRYKNAEVVWCQEEPANMGAWTFIDRRIENLLDKIDSKAERPIYAGRAEAASPATGLAKRHAKEQAALVDQALQVG
ncbi:MAG: 2-oxoglutarate dehydrogenase E1 component [Rhodospirillaceae bacterium]|nr:2-oxoglutarate dehydrogenase E1 component [Rhodospirillaceae bacterium]|tara:strand:- start:29229 stop:32096 length:2868 start_codon:yes stop_codon:yes gene_type:complete